MKATIELRDGEASLESMIFESESLHEVVQEALRRDLKFHGLQIDRVTKEGLWKSTEESTIPAAVLYFRGNDANDYLITKRSQEEKYALFKYRWTP